MTHLDLWLLFGVLGAALDMPMMAKRYREGYDGEVPLHWWIGYVMMWEIAWPILALSKVVIQTHAIFQARAILERAELLRSLDALAATHDNPEMLKASLRELSLPDLRKFARDMPKRGSDGQGPPAS